MLKRERNLRLHIMVTHEEWAARENPHFFVYQILNA